MEKTMNESETGTCAFCCKPMPTDAIKCSSCQNWRRDIFLLIRDYRRMATTQLVCLAIGLPAVLRLSFVAGKDATRIDFSGHREFSFDDFVRSPSLWLAVVVALLGVVVYRATQIPAARIGNRIQQLTGGLWQRWKV
jgi:hypothetical protein